MHYWLGPWIWQSEGDGGPFSWNPPAGCLGCVDLRPLPACAAAGGPPLGVGLFALEDGADPGPAYFDYGTEPDQPVTPTGRLFWEQRLLGVGRPLLAATLGEALWETLTVQSDPTGQQRPLALVPSTHQRQWKLTVAGQVWRRKHFDPVAPEAVPLQALLQATYQRIRDDTLRGVHTVNFHRKFLGTLVNKYGLPYRWFQGPGVPDETPLDPDTTLTESFDTSDGDTLGPDLTWTEVQGDTDVASNQAHSTSNLCANRAESDLSSDDHYAEIDCTTFASNARPTINTRFHASAHTCYVFWVRNNSSNTFRLLKTVAGTDTTLATQSDTPPSATFRLRLETDGSDLDGQVDDVSQVTVTDTSLTGNTRTGFGTRAVIVVDMDDFEAGDLAAFDPTSRPLWMPPAPVFPPARVARY